MVDTSVTERDQELLRVLRQELAKDIALTIANFKVWLLATVLSNIVLVGLPALYVFFTTSSMANSAMDLSLDNRTRLDGRTDFMNSTETRVSNIEMYLKNNLGYDTGVRNRSPLPR